MKIQTGYLYHIKNEFFEIVNDPGLITNHEGKNTRPTYLAIKDKNILWFIPLSSKVEKYKKLIEQKQKKYGTCKTILIEEIRDRKQAILIQNAFPTLVKYVDHAHTIMEKEIKFDDKIIKEITKNFLDVLELKRKGINLFFADIDKIKKQMEEEIVKDQVNS